MSSVEPQIPIPAPIIGSPQLIDWLILLTVIIIGGTSFSMIKVAVATVPPVIIAVSRLWIGALVLIGLMLAAGRRFPPLFEHGRLSQRWQFMMACGAIGNAIPFFLFPWAQQYVASGLAGVYMALMPIWTLGLAALFAGEALTGRRLAGFALGFAGVIVLMAPVIVRHEGDIIAPGSLLAQLAIVLATLCYATSAVLARRAPDIRPRAFAAGILLCAAIFSTPALFFADWHRDQWTLLSMANVALLGVFPTGLGGILIIIIIQRVGAGFMSFANYVTPIWAIILGALLFGEQLRPSAFLALAVVILGLAISQSGRR